MAAEQLVAYALRLGSSDNVSAIVVRLGNAPLGPSVEELREKALRLQREGRFIPMKLRQYLGNAPLGTSVEELREKALKLQREGKYIPMKLKQYLK